jgi:hypothetical protein
VCGIIGLLEVNLALRSYQITKVAPFLLLYLLLSSVPYPAVHFSNLTVHLTISLQFIYRTMPGLKRGEGGSDDEFESSMDNQMRERDRREQEREAKTPRGVRPQQVGVGVGVLLENMIEQLHVFFEGFSCHIASIFLLHRKYFPASSQAFSCYIASTLPPSCS